LRETILNLAVRGKLAPQDPSDEPASELLKRTPLLPKPARYEKRSPELIPGDCGLSINNPGTRLPKGWLWVPLVKIARLESGHTPSRNRPDWWGGDVPWIGLVDARLHNNGTIFKTIQTTNQQGLANSASRLLPKGTVCFSRTASVGYVVIMGRPMATSQDFVNWVPTGAISSSWLQLVMIAERPAIGRFSKGAVHQTIYYPAWLSMHIALPPLTEQHRIVVKVNELIALR
jgi:type I restriction enzyme, S subunit